MRPSLSPLEKGAYGTPFSVVSVVGGGPQPSPSGRAAMISERDGIGTDLLARYGRSCDIAGPEVVIPSDEGSL